MEKSKRKIRRYFVGALALSVLLSNFKIVFAETISEENNKSEKWKLKWSDEFNEDSLNMDNWTYEIGNWILDENGNKVSQGWGNNEAQYYTRGENLSIKDGNLVITAKKVDKEKEKYDNCNYTSTRIKTEDKVTAKYGRIEARIKMPKGNGIWPAFWMMPNDDKYGGWAASGEIDIMEAKGRIPNEVNGTIHYGGIWPNNRYSGSHYRFEEGTDITDFHDYAIEWEPGEIRWYVDNELYQVQDNWNTYGKNEDLKYSFPAPFDQDFYIILNLAIGGNYDGGILPENDFSSAEMLVDYVRVYDKSDEYEYKDPKEPNIEKGELPEGSKEAIDGNYIYDTSYDNGFNKIINGDEAFSNTWNLLTLKQFGGEASISTDKLDNTTFAKIDISKPGSEVHSIQLIQYMTLAKGRTYKLSYDAKASSNRNISVKASGGEERGWTTYSNVYSDSLTNDVNHFEHVFTMAQNSDIKARLEFNVGTSNPSVWIGNVKVEEFEESIDYNAPKKPLSDGNHIYNGTFDRGLVDRKTYWNLSGDANYFVPESSRDLCIDVKNNTNNYEDVVLNQKGIMLVGEANHTLTFKAKADKDRDIKLVMKDSNSDNVLEKTISLEKEFKEYNLEFKFNTSGIDNNGTIEFLLGGTESQISIDNIELKCDGLHEPPKDIEKFLIKNGDFKNGLEGWKAWNWEKNDDFINDIKVKDGKAVIEVPKVGETGDASQTWGVQFKQTDLLLNKDVEYELSFNISSSIDREVEVVLQNSGYYRVFENKISVSPEVKEHKYIFKATGTEAVELNFLLGKFGDYNTHEVSIDNVVLKVEGAVEENPEDNVVKFPLSNGKFDNGLEGWKAWNWIKNDNFISDVKVENGEAIIPIPELKNNGIETWAVQFRQTNLPLTKDIEYEISFDIRSNIDRELEVVVQNSGYYRVFEDKISVSPEVKKYENTFKATGSEIVELNFLLGKFAEYSSHEVYIDNVVLKVKGAEENPGENPGENQGENPGENPKNSGQNSEKSGTLPDTGNETANTSIGISSIILALGLILIKKKR